MVQCNTDKVLGTSKVSKILSTLSIDNKLILFFMLIQDENDHRVYPGGIVYGFTDRIPQSDATVLQLASGRSGIFPTINGKNEPRVLYLWFNKPIHKAVCEAFVNMIIHADYLMDAGDS